MWLSLLLNNTWQNNQSRGGIFIDVHDILKNKLQDGLKVIIDEIENVLGTLLNKQIRNVDIPGINWPQNYDIKSFKK